MNTEECPDCGREVSCNAKVCPHCGGKTRYAQRAENSRIELAVVWVMIIMGVIMFLAFVASH